MVSGYVVVVIASQGKDQWPGELFQPQRPSSCSSVSRMEHMCGVVRMSGQGSRGAKIGHMALRQGKGVLATELSLHGSGLLLRVHVRASRGREGSGREIRTRSWAWNGQVGAMLVLMPEGFRRALVYWK